MLLVLAHQVDPARELVRPLPPPTQVCLQH